MSNNILQNLTKSLKSKHWKAIRLYVAKDYTHQKIADELEVSRVTISNWFGKEDFQAGIEEDKQRLLEEIKVSHLKTIQHMANMSFYDIEDMFDEEGHLKDPKTMPKELRAAICSLEVKEYYIGKGEEAKLVTERKYKMVDKLAATKIFGEWQGLFKNQLDLNHSGAVGSIDLSGMSIEEIQAEKKKINALRG